MKRLLRTFLQFQIRHPGLVLSILAAVTLVFSILATGVEFDFTIENLFAQGDPEVDAYFEFREDFEREDDLIYLAYVTSDPFSYKNLLITRELTSAFENIEGVAEVTSLANVELFEESEDLILSPVYQIIPKDPDTMALLKDRILYTPILMDNLISQNATVGAFILSVEDDYNNHDERERILEEITAIQEKASWEWHEAGIPVLRTRYVQYMLDDYFRFFMPIVTVLVVVLFLLFRTWRGVLLPLITVLIADIWTMGIMVLLGFKVNIVTYIVPTLVLIIGVADSIHILVKFHEELTHNDDKLHAVSETIKKIGAAILLTSMTTAVGFMSLLSTNILIIRQFGLMVGIAVVLAFISSVTFIPCMLAILKKPSEERLYRSTHSFRHRFITWVTKVNNRYQVPIVLGSGLTVVLCIILVMRVDPHSSLMEDLRGGNELYDDMRFMEREMGSVLPLEVVVTVIKNGEPAEGSIKDPQVIRQISELQAMLASIPEIGKTISLADYLREMNQAFHSGDPKLYVIPDSREKISQYLLLNEGEIDFLINYDYSSTRIAGRIQDITSKRAMEISNQILEWSREHLSDNLEIKLTGTTLMALKTNQYLVQNLAVSFIIAFVVIFFSMWILFRSIKLASLSMIPNFIPLLMMAGIMGLLHIKLRPTTAMTFAIAFGIAVDDTIHFLARFRQELFSNNGNYRAANERTLLTTGKAIVSTSIILVAGFLVMVTSNFIPSRDFGFLSAMTLLGALIGDLFFLPSVLALAKPKIPFLGRFFLDENS